MTSISQSLPPTMTFFHDNDDKLLDLTGRQFTMAATPRGDDHNTQQDSAQASASLPLKRAASPAPSSALSSIQDFSSTNDPEQIKTTAIPRTDSAPPAKRRKLTPAEKTEKERVKAEQKAVKEEEKRIKNEEKRKAAEEREAKKRERDLEAERKKQEVERKKQESDRKKQEMEESKAKKDRAQPKVFTFFAKSSIEKQADEDVQITSTGVLTRHRSLSLETYEQLKKEAPDSPLKKEIINSPTKAPARKADYHKHFLPFSVKPGVSVHQMPKLEGSELEAAQERFDHLTMIPASSSEYDLGLRGNHSSLSYYFTANKSRIRGRATSSIRQMIEHMPTTSTNTIDLTGDNEFAGVPVKYLHFYEDIRPAYFGTYSKIYDKSLIRKTQRNPHVKLRTDTDYDYDSEAEWEADPEGEDLGDEDSEADTEDDVSEMGGFIDDEDDRLKDRPRLLQGGKVPTSSGMCWADQYGKSQVDPASNASDDCLIGLRMQFLLTDLTITTIDPFSDAYWQKSTPKNATNASKLNTTERTPLKERDSNTFSIDSGSGFLVPPKPTSTTKKHTKQGTQKTMSNQEFDGYKSVIVGSTLGKNELVSLLKDKFPDFTMALIKDTLSEKFAQVGKSKADKKWVFVGTQE